MLPERVGLSGRAGRSSSPVAVISRSLDEMVGICGEFELSEDGLDEFNFAVYRYVGKYFLLLRYFNYPGEGDVFMHDGEFDSEALFGFLSGIGLSESDVSWMLGEGNG
ncbi:hypothetical protein [Pseudomonas aeruginosa]|uniref:hypothetical protein n=1 Tax=Pseudomonas aeruginosa TaxID=287 RepID=UPI0013795FE3|nr:hypothetical protein [Pseudomonas aeruginosa]